MKTKYMFITLIILFAFLLYNLFCYGFINKMIDNNSRNIINRYLENICGDCEYKYLRATLNDDDSINVFVDVQKNNQKEKYRFVLIRNNGVYNVVDVNNDIPIYIK